MGSRCAPHGVFRGAGVFLFGAAQVGGEGGHRISRGVGDLGGSGAAMDDGGEFGRRVLHERPEQNRVQVDRRG